MVSCLLLRSENCSVTGRLTCESCFVPVRYAHVVGLCRYRRVVRMRAQPFPEPRRPNSLLAPAAHTHVSTSHMLLVDLVRLLLAILVIPVLPEKKIVSKLHQLDFTAIYSQHQTSPPPPSNWKCTYKHKNLTQPRHVHPQTPHPFHIPKISCP